MSFASSVRINTQKQGENLRRFRKAVFFELFSSVINDTPVLTGRLRGNWQCSIDTAKGGTLGIRSGSDAIGEVRGTIDSLTGDRAVVLANNLPYAVRIEYDGWSHTKAPAGMVRINLNRVAANIQKHIAKGPA
jgi:hypothetical protein